MKIELDELMTAFNIAYDHFYENCGDPVTDRIESIYCQVFDKLAEDEKSRYIIGKFCEYRHDLITSDREAAAFTMAYRCVLEVKSKEYKTAEQKLKKTIRNVTMTYNDILLNNA